MNRYNGMPEMLERFMQEQEADERWVTVLELRNRFSLTRYQCNTVSGFLRRLGSGPFGGFPFIVASIVRQEGEKPSDPKKYRYLLRLRKNQAAAQGPAREPGTVHGTE